MSIITVTSPKNRLSLEQRRVLAESLTDALLEQEIGQLNAMARIGFQVHFVETPSDTLAIGGKLLSDYDPPLDVININIMAMEGSWPAEVRAKVIENILATLAKACGLEKAPPTWWVTFQIIDEGNWGAQGRVLSILDLLDLGVFTPERADAIRRTITGQSS